MPIHMLIRNLEMAQGYLLKTRPHGRGELSFSDALRLTALPPGPKAETWHDILVDSVKRRSNPPTPEMNTQEAAVTQALREYFPNIRLGSEVSLEMLINNLKRRKH